MKKKKLLTLGTVVAVMASTLIGCGGSNKESTNDKEIYFLNFKPEIADVYDKIAKDYEDETGVRVKVETAASGNYEQTLKSEMAKDDAPTIFQLNGPVGYNTWKDYCSDLKDSDLYKHLSDKTLAVTSEGGIYGIPYAVEGYGIIYNADILNKYIALPNKKTAIKSADDIKDFNTLKAVAEDIQANKDALGIKGTFASTSMSSGNRWRWDTHLANIPFYYEFADKAGDDSIIDTGLASDEVEFKYADKYKDIFDLYTSNSCTEKGVLGSKSVDDAMADFALGNCAMVQNGNWAWAQISKVQGNVVKEENIKFLPIYTGMDKDSEQGICIGTENYFAVNSKVSEEKQKESKEFINWLFTSEKGKSYVVKDLGFIAPFDTFTENEKPSDPLSKEIMDWMNKKDIKNVNWIFQSFPSENFKTAFSDTLLEYVQGTKEWKDVVDTVKKSWKEEKGM
ncbi:ABC transporter substrate-binding protein [uncultured Clostridium sp.]|uniref:ABC transporter substrate-binding protein n=1 Tax=uncultured Clostridium sp. TaxID=59620 RepID=UPI0025F887F3|nr:ABC transporter substrate-binding protein [uncultured Clostridium sp.]